MNEYFWDYVVMNFYHLGVQDTNYLGNPEYWKYRCVAHRLVELKLEMTGNLDAHL